MKSATLICTSLLPRSHNGVKYQKKSPDGSYNLRQQLSLYCKIFLEGTTSFHINTVSYNSYAARRISSLGNMIRTLDTQSLNATSTLKGSAETISTKEIHIYTYHLH